MNLKATEQEKLMSSGIKDQKRELLKTISTYYESGEIDSRQNMIVFSHLRWDFVFQRPQHLMTRFSKEANVYFVEEPIYHENIEKDYLEISPREHGIKVVIPKLKPGRNAEEVESILEYLISGFVEDNKMEDFIAWYYTPMALGFTGKLNPTITVFDCMDELSAFKNAPALLVERESKLLRQADLVFTGGYSLYEAKKNLHDSVYAFPSSIELEHFKVARKPLQEPEDQKNIPAPRIGFYGVIDERMDIELVGDVARRKPEWHFVFLGPVVKISQESLPNNENIHYLGMKTYSELPQYLSGWDVAMLPFALNESTRFISPTKTPEYLAAGKPVVSSAIKDVVHSYGNNGLVSIFHDADSFISAVEKALSQTENKEWLQKVDQELSTNSWDLTQGKMSSLIAEKILIKR